jgi:hypothetical protein
MNKTTKKKSLIRKYKNLGYALVIFFYIDMSIGAFAYVGNDVIERYQIRQDAASILDTPNLTGVEELEEAVEMDLAELQARYAPNNS